MKTTGDDDRELCTVSKTNKERLLCSFFANLYGFPPFA